MIFKKSFKKGFTLIELLVVVAIIGLLSSIVSASLSIARSKARDAKRLAETHSIQSALELYFNDNGFYPNGCAASNGLYVDGWSALLSSSYINSMPNDPLNTVTQYGYYYCSEFKLTGNCSPPHQQTSGIRSNYILATRLENVSTGPHSCPSGFGGWDNLFLNYIVGIGP
ncbi:MAG: prepilin-type N-terminal cleavage/methylation domain-containing protein [Candidatus Paceibacterota bacterium]|jgi:type II secretion system protein G